MDLSIIIVNWNSADYLRACLTTIYQYSHGFTYEVIVVDNASDDGCEDVLHKNFPNVTFVQSGSNLGFARGNNLGYSKSSGQCLLFLNPDTEIVKDALNRLIAHLSADSSLGAVGPRLLNTDGTLQGSCVQAFPTISNQLLDSDLLRSWFPHWRGWGTRVLHRDTDVPCMVDAISGACLMVKRAVFEEVGHFSERYFMYSDDLDLCHKIHTHGYGIHYMNECEIVHHGGKSSDCQGDHFSDLWQKESMLEFLRDTKGRFYGGLYRLSMAGVAAIRASIVVVLMLFGRARVQGRPAGAVLQKWSRILVWAIGLRWQNRMANKGESAA